MRRYLFGAILGVFMVSNVMAEEAPLNVQEWRSAVEVLALAREKISRGGWYQVEVIERAECLTTALEKSWQELGKSLVDWDYTKLAMDTAISGPSLHTLSEKGDPLATPYWGRYYMYWNDAGGRSAKDVLAALDRAIGYAREQEKNALKVNASGDLLIQFDIRMMDKLNLRIAEKYRKLK